MVIDPYAASIREVIKGYLDDKVFSPGQPKSMSREVIYDHVVLTLVACAGNLAKLDFCSC